MNESDSQRIASSLNSISFSPVSREHEADLIIANLCSVRQKGIDRVWGKIKVWENLPKKPKIYLTGCILKGDRQKFEKRVDGIFNINLISSPNFPALFKKKKIDKYLINSNPLSYFDINPIANCETPKA